MRKNALDIALDGFANPEQGGIIDLLVTAGPTMTGNSVAYRTGKTPREWRRQFAPLDSTLAVAPVNAALQHQRQFSGGVTLRHESPTQTHH